MPSVDRERLQRQAEAAFERLPNTEGAARALSELFQFYGVHPGRMAHEARTGEGGRQFGAPAIVAAVVRSTLLETQASPEVWRRLAAELWSSGFRELREVAGMALAAGVPADALQTLPDFLRAEITGSDLQILAENVLEPLRQGSPDLYWEWLENSTGGNERYYRRLVFASLGKAVADREFAIKPRLFELLRGLGPESHGWERVEFESLIRNLSHRLALETAHFLEGEIRQNPLDTRLIRLLNSLGAEDPVDSS